MIEVFCGCPVPRRVPDAGIGQSYSCSRCNQVTYLICAEALTDDAGGGDFDAAFTVIEGPAHLGEKVQLGGIEDVTIGKAADRHLCLAGPKVSRGHAKLVRVDFGPSRWKVVDQRSTNGLFVNGQRVEEQELRDGDEVRVGDFLLRYGHVAAIAVPTAELTVAGGVTCPACERSLKKKAKICTDCGINVITGRPILTRQGVDEDVLYGSAETWIRFISLLVWVTPFPIPIRSEAFGTRKPYAIWTIAVATILASVTFFIVQTMDARAGGGRAHADLMLWAPRSGNATAVAAPILPPAKIHEIALRMDNDERAELRAQYGHPNERPTDDQLVTRALAAAIAEHQATRGEFHWYQLVTHAFLHDTSSVYNFAMHLGGNLVFMLCFGTRVNALIGNIATAVLYPILAACAATVHLMSLGDGPSGPMVGASGAIMGLAGMYLVLFPVHRVFCAMWISIWLRFKRIYGCKIFGLRGFWILLIYFGYDITMELVSRHFGLRESVAHWAHIGGFTTGAILGFVVLLSRLFDTHGGDVLSVTLGRYAWPLVGKPGHRRKSAALAAPAMPAYA